MIANTAIGSVRADHAPKVKTIDEKAQESLIEANDRSFKYATIKVEKTAEWRIKPILVDSHVWRF